MGIIFIAVHCVQKSTIMVKFIARRSVNFVMVICEIGDHEIESHTIIR